MTLTGAVGPLPDSDDRLFEEGRALRGISCPVIPLDADEEQIALGIRYAEAHRRAG